MQSRRALWGVAFVLLLLTFLVSPAPPMHAQGTLSNQVLQLLSRVNSWTASNTFYNLIIPKIAIPSSTTARIYADPSGNLYYDGGLIAGAGGGVTPHNFLSSTHPDTLAGSPTRGAVVAGNSTPAWAAVSPTTGFVQYNGTDTVFSTSLANGTNIPAANLTGTIAAISGANLTSLNASNLGSGTVPVARLSGITNTQIDAAAAIAYSKLALTGLIVNADISGSAAIGYGKLALTNSIVAGDLTSSSVTMAKIAQAGATSGQVITWNGSAWAPATPTAGGTVTSVALSLPGIFTVSGSPVTTTGTLTASLASQTANYVWAAPNGSAGAPTFRAFVNADLPTSGVAAGTYPKVTVNNRGVVTAASTTITAATDISGQVPAANGGTGITAVTDDTTIVASGSAWVSTALPNCTKFWAYTTSTNLFSCTAGYSTGSIAASTPLTIATTFNNAGVNFEAVSIDITDTASTAVSNGLRVTRGGTSQWSVRKDGAMLQVGIAFASLGTPVDGTQTYCPDCTYNSNPCTGGSTGAIAKRINGAWRCD